MVTKVLGWKEIETEEYISPKYIDFGSSGNILLFNHSVISDSWQPHGLQHARLPCPSPTPGVYSNSCPSSR